MSRNHMYPGEVTKRLWDQHEVVRTKWLTGRAEAISAVTELFGREQVERSALVTNGDWAKLACVRIGALAWVETEQSGIRKSVTRAVCVDGVLTNTHVDFPLQELLQSALPRFELRPEAICAAFQKFGTGGTIARKGEVTGFGRTSKITPPTVSGDELAFVGRRGHRILSCVCHLPSRRAWLSVLNTISVQS